MFTTEVAAGLEKRLAADETFQRYTRFFEADVALVGIEPALALTFRGPDVRCAVAETETADIVLSVSPEGWASLADPEAINVTLTHWLRKGEVRIDGDVDRAMSNWRPLFWAVARLREQLTGKTDF